MNTVLISGNLGHTPQLKHSRTTGTSYLSGSIAVNKTVNGGKVTQWFNFKAFGGTAELIARSFSKGDKIGLIGSLDTRDYTDKDGNQRTIVEVVANQVEFYSSRNSGGGIDAEAEAKPTPQVYEQNFQGFAPISNTDGDLPF